MSTRARMIFVAGNSRSGTTVLARVLGRHSAIHTLPELHYIEEIWDPVHPSSLDITPKKLLRLIQNADNHYFDALDARKYEERASQLQSRLPPSANMHDALQELMQIEYERTGKSIICEQTPKNVYFIDDLLAVFPHSQVIVITRDPRDVVYSQKHWWRTVFRIDSFPWRRLPWKVTALRWARYHPRVTASLWASGADHGQKAARDPRVHQIRFEDFVTDPRGCLAPFLSALDLSYEAEMLNVSGSNSSHVGSRSSNSGLDTSAVGRWRTGLTNSEAWVVEDVSFPIASEFGYVRESRKPTLAAFAAVYAILPLKLLVAGLFQLSEGPQFLARAVRRFRKT